MENGGKATVYTVNGGSHEIRAASDGLSFISNKVNINPPWQYKVFDMSKESKEFNSKSFFNSIPQPLQVKVEIFSFVLHTVMNNLLNGSVAPLCEQFQKILLIIQCLSDFNQRLHRYLSLILKALVNYVCVNFQ